MDCRYRLILFTCVLTFGFLFSNLKGTARNYQKNDDWKVYLMYVSSVKEPVFNNPFEEADTIGYVYYRDKVLLIEDGWGKFGWKKIVHPIFGYMKESNLITPKEKSDNDKKFGLPEGENEYSKWNWEVLSCTNDFVFVKSQMNEASANVGLLIDNEKTIVIKEQFDFQNVWVKTPYPFQGYIKYFDAFESGGYNYFALGLTYGAKHIPYEKNLKNYFNPIGGYLEFGNTNWFLTFRAGYNYSESRLSTFYVKTDQAYLHLVFRIFRLFDNKLELYALAGGNYWFSSFENKKYEGGNAYFKLEKDSGPGYAAGGGFIYYLSNFYIEGQYVIFGSKQAEFGTKPAQGVFANYSTLYPGSNHFEIIFGYRIVL